MTADGKPELLHAPLTARIIGAFYAVYNELGHGFLEAVYEKALLLELQRNGLQVSRQEPIAVRYKGDIVGEYLADLVVENAVILELKATQRIDPIHEAQLLHYLRATDLEVGLLLNFGPKPEFRRLVFENRRKTISAFPRQSAAKA
ncbi:MAG TPA: GxxExxY protein [bacterium]|nr:GxxExxY protein [bacterium]